MHGLQDDIHDIAESDDNLSAVRLGVGFALFWTNSGWLLMDGSGRGIIAVVVSWWVSYYA